VAWPPLLHVQVAAALAVDCPPPPSPAPALLELSPAKAIEDAERTAANMIFFIRFFIRVIFYVRLNGKWWRGFASSPRRCSVENPPETASECPHGASTRKMEPPAKLAAQTQYPPPGIHPEKIHRIRIGPMASAAAWAAPRCARPKTQHPEEGSELDSSDPTREGSPSPCTNSPTSSH